MKSIFPTIYHDNSIVVTRTQDERLLTVGANDQ